MCTQLEGHNCQHPCHRVVFERTNRANSESPSSHLRLSPMSPILSQRPLPQSPAQERQTAQPDPAYGHTGHIYSQVQPQTMYGQLKPPPPAYSHAPPYRAKDPSHLPPLQLMSPPSPKKSVTSPKQVHFAATPRSSGESSSSSQVRSSSSPQVRSSPMTRSEIRASPSTRSASSDGSSVSGPSSIDSSLYDDTLAVIEKSNQELEQRLSSRAVQDKSSKRPSKSRIDTIHNHRQMDQEIIFEEDSDLSRTSSVSTLKMEPFSPMSPQGRPGQHPDHHPGLHPDHPSLADMGSIADLSGKFQSLTARKLMAGLSISSIDTLLEVNAANDGNKLSILNESTETIDFGVI